MNIIADSRQTGKTTRLIQISAETGLPIIALDRNRIDNIKNLAHKMQVDIPEPIHWTSTPFYREVLVDDAEDILQALFYKYYHANVSAITVTTGEQ